MLNAGYVCKSKSRQLQVDWIEPGALSYKQLLKLEVAIVHEIVPKSSWATKNCLRQS